MRSRSVEDIALDDELLASFANVGYGDRVTTMNVSLPEQLRAFVDEQVDQGGYGSTSEYVRELIRRDQDRQRLRSVLLDGAGSEPGPVADEAYFASLRQRVPTD